MPEARIVELLDKITQSAGGTIKCPICAHESWVNLDLVFSVMTSTLQYWRDANADEDATEPRQSAPDDAGASATVAAVCDNCGFLRLHLIQPQALLE
jgi:hypothetical protein